MFVSVVEMIDFKDLVEKKNFSEFIEMSMEELYKNGGPVYIFIQLKQSGVESELLRQLASIMFRDDSNILQKVLSHLD